MWCTMGTSIRVIFIVTVATALAYASDPHGSNWDYDRNSKSGPSHWGNLKPLCHGRRQSPINIETKKAVYSAALKPLTFKNYDKAPRNGMYEITNTGHSLSIDVDDSSNQAELVFNNTTWRLFNIHFHWGSKNSIGSEHTIDSKVYPVECHMVHFNTKYANSSKNFMNQTDGLLVLGTFIKVLTNPALYNKNYEKFITYLRDVRPTNKKTNVTAFPISELLPRSSIQNYFTYPGSLTTPECFESVTWIVNREFAEISQQQLDEFRKLKSSSRALVDNFRPIQDLHGRVVKKNFFSKSSGNMLSSLYYVTVALVVFSSAKNN